MSEGATTFESITILRGLAAVGIMIFHVRIFLWTGWKNIWSNPDQFSIFDRAVASLTACSNARRVCTTFLRYQWILYPLPNGRKPENARP